MRSKAAVQKMKIENHIQSDTQHTCDEHVMILPDLVNEQKMPGGLVGQVRSRATILGCIPLFVFSAISLGLGRLRKQAFEISPVSVTTSYFQSILTSITHTLRVWRMWRDSRSIGNSFQITALLFLFFFLFILIFKLLFYPYILFLHQSNLIFQGYFCQNFQFWLTKTVLLIIVQMRQVCKSLMECGTLPSFAGFNEVTIYSYMYSYSYE